jgi:hypothetical protein
VKDWRGTEIVPGSLIVYPQRQASHLSMIEAKVLAITQKLNVSGELIPVLRVQRTSETTYFGVRNLAGSRASIVEALSRVTVVR